MKKLMVNQLWKAFQKYKRVSKQSSEKSKKENKRSEKSAMFRYLIIWLSSIFVFSYLLWMGQNQPWPGWKGWLFVISMLIGTVSFIALVLDIEKYFRSKYSSRKATFFSVTTFFTLLSLGIALIIGSLNVFSQTAQNSKQASDEAKIASKYDLINPGITVRTTSEDVKVIQAALKTDPLLYPSGAVSGYYGPLTKEAVRNFQNKYSLTPTGNMDNETTEKFNEVYGNNTRNYYLSLYPTNIPVPVTQTNTTSTDPIIDCVSSYPNCNGSSIKAPKSQCSKITCCQIGNSWSVYATDEQCDEAQKNTQQQTVPQNTTKTQGNNVYCWNNAYGYGYYTSSGDQCNLDNAKTGTYKLCMDSQKMKSDSCNSSCKNTLDHDNGVCAWAYTGTNPGIEQSTSQYGECLNGAGGTGENYSICLGKCSDQYAQDIKQCGN